MLKWEFQRNLSPEGLLFKARDPHGSRGRRYPVLVQEILRKWRSPSPGVLTPAWILKKQIPSGMGSMTLRAAPAGINADMPLIFFLQCSFRVVNHSRRDPSSQCEGWGRWLSWLTRMVLAECHVC